MSANYFIPAQISPEAIRTTQEKRRSDGIRSIGISMAQMRTRAAAEAASLGHSAVGVEHLLLALMSYSTPDSAFLKERGLTPAKVRESIKSGISWSVTSIGFPNVKFYKVPARKSKDW